MSKERYRQHVANRKAVLEQLPRHHKLYRISCYVRCQERTCRPRCRGWRKIEGQENSYLQPCCECEHTLSAHLLPEFFSIDESRLNEMLETTIDIDFVLTGLRTSPDRDNRDAYIYVYWVLARSMRGFKRPKLFCNSLLMLPYENSVSVKKMLPNVVSHKFSGFDRNTWNATFDIMMRLKDCLNNWELPYPSRLVHYLHPRDLNEYRINYKRWLVYCYVPGYCASLPSFQFQEVFGKTMMRIVYAKLFLPHFRSVLLDQMDGMTNQRRAAVLRCLDPILQMFEFEIYSDTSPVWRKDFEPFLCSQYRIGREPSLDRAERIKVLAEVYEKFAQESQGMTVRSRAEYYYRIQKLRQKLCSFPRTDKLIRLARHSKCQGAICECNGGRSASDTYQPKLEDRCCYCEHSLERHVTHLLGYPEEVLDKLLCLTIHVEELCMQLDKEQDDDCRRVFIYVLNLLRASIRDVVTDDVIAHKSTELQPPFNEPCTIMRAITNFMINKLDYLGMTDFSTMVDMSRMFLNCLNHWSMKKSSMRHLNIDPLELPEYKLCYRRWLLHCHLPVFFSFLPYTDTAYAFGKTFLRVVYRRLAREILDGVYEIGPKSNATIYHFCPKFLAMLEIEVYSDDSTIWNTTDQYEEPEPMSVDNFADAMPMSVENPPESEDLTKDDEEIPKTDETVDDAVASNEDPTEDDEEVSETDETVHDEVASNEDSTEHYEEISETDETVDDMVASNEDLMEDDEEIQATDETVDDAVASNEDLTENDEEIQETDETVDDAVASNEDLTENDEEIQETDETVDDAVASNEVDMI